jgi:hypothetical protein
MCHFADLRFADPIFFVIGGFVICEFAICRSMHFCGLKTFASPQIRILSYYKYRIYCVQNKKVLKEGLWDYFERRRVVQYFVQIC